jgi:polyhydroxyalkanoate synthesis regulator phasin
VDAGLEPSQEGCRRTLDERLESARLMADPSALERRVSELEKLLSQTVEQLSEAHAVMLALQGVLIRNGVMTAEEFESVRSEVRAKIQTVRDSLDETTSQRLSRLLAGHEGPEN